MLMRARHSLLADWLDLSLPDDDAEFGRIKQRLAAEGVNARGWRLYLEYGDCLFEALGQPFLHKDWPLTSGPNAIAFLKLLAASEMDVPPPCALVATMREWRIPRDSIEVVPVHFFRALWKATQLQDYASGGESAQVQEFLRESVVPLANWFFSTGGYVDADTNKLKSGWGTLQRDYEAWGLERLKAREVLSSVRAFEQVRSGQNGAAIKEQTTGAVVATVADTYHAIVAITGIGTIAGVGVVRSRCYHEK